MNMEVSQFLEIEQYVTRLKRSIAAIIKDVPDDKKWLGILNDGSQDQRVKLLAGRPKIEAAVVLKTLHEDGHLPVFDEILKVDSIDANRKIDTEKITQQYEGIDDNILSIRKVKEYINDNKALYPPRLPLIQDDNLFYTVFKHKLCFPPLESNEQLVVLGDSVLGTISTQIIFEVFPDISGAKFKVLRNLLLSSENMVQFTKDYHLDEYTNDNQVDASKMGLVYADVFVAYIGAVAKESNCDYSLIKAWLSFLVDPVVKGVNISSLDDSEGSVVNDDFVAQLDAKLQPTGAGAGGNNSNPTTAISYRTAQFGNGADSDYIVECYISSTTLGTGAASTYREARQLAAKDALTNSNDKLNDIIGAKSMQVSLKLNYFGGGAVKSGGLGVKPAGSNGLMALDYNNVASGGDAGGAGSMGMSMGMGIGPDMVNSSNSPFPSLHHLGSGGGGGGSSIVPPGVVGGPMLLNGGVGANGMLGDQAGSGTGSGNSSNAQMAMELVPSRPIGEHPFVLDPLPEEDLDKSAKEKLHVLFSKNKLAAPTFKNRKVLDNAVESTLYFGQLAVATCMDTNKKKASQRIAMWMINNHKVLQELGVQNFFD